jgi:hypothetical protein
MPAWWNSVETVSLLKTAAQWLGPGVTFMGIVVSIFGIVVGSRLETLKKIEVEKTRASDLALLEDANRRAAALEEQQKAWDLSPEQWSLFSEQLKDAPKGRVAVEYIRSDEKRVYDLTTKISAQLKDLGYDVWGYIPGFQQAGSAPLVGVMIQFMDPQTDVVGSALQQAFEAIGIPTSAARRNNQNYDADVTIIWIGSKP